MEKSPLEEAVERSLQLEEIEERLKTASGQTEDLFKVARETAETKLVKLSRKREVRTALVETRKAFEDEDQELSYLRETDLLDDSVLAERRQQLLERHRGNPQFRLAERVLGGIAIAGETEGEVTIDSETRERTLKFLSRDPGILANRLIGMTLFANGRTAVINEVQPQYPDDNARWIKRPIFGQDRVDAFVSSHRGSNILFLRAGTKSNPDCCVKIVSVAVDGTVHDKQSYVPSALGLEGFQTGDLELDVNENELRLVNIKDPEPKD